MVVAQKCRWPEIADLRDMLDERMDFQKHRESMVNVDPRGKAAEVDTPSETGEDNVSPPAEGSHSLGQGSLKVSGNHILLPKLGD